MLPVKGSITLNNAETLYELALQGLGVIRLSDLIVGPAIRNGKLVPILVDSHQPEPLPVHAVYAAGRRRPPKVDAVIQFLAEKFSSAPWRTVPSAPLPAARGRVSASKRRGTRR
jgi:DNA-binding transcriptional LysR family regulator